MEPAVANALGIVGGVPTFLSLGGGTRNGRPQTVVALEPPVFSELFEDETEPLVAHMKQGTQVGSCSRVLAESVQDGRGEVASSLLRVGLDELEMQVACVVVADQVQRDRVDRGRGTVLDREQEVITPLA